VGRRRYDGRKGRKKEKKKEEEGKAKERGNILCCALVSFSFPSIRPAAGADAKRSRVKKRKERRKGGERETGSRRYFRAPRCSLIICLSSSAVAGEGGGETSGKKKKKGGTEKGGNGQRFFRASHLSYLSPLLRSAVGVGRRKKEEGAERKEEREKYRQLLGFFRRLLPLITLVSCASEKGEGRGPGKEKKKKKRKRGS